MTDVLFIHSPMILYQDKDDALNFRSHGGDEKSYYPLGILYMAACLEKKGHSVSMIDVAAEGKTLVDVLGAILEKKPRIIGISSMTTSIASAVSLAKAIKEKFGDSIPVGLGGVHMCCDPTIIERFPYFDFGIKGEGEITFPKLVDRVKKGEKIKGIIPGELVADLDAIPFPARHLVNPDIYRREEQMKFEVPAAGILGSRGCPFGCAFCCIPAIGHKVRFRSVKNVVDEMVSVYDDCRGAYSFVDDCMTLDRNRTLAFCQEIQDRKLSCRWIASTRVNTMDDEVVRALKRAGCTDLYFGVESGHERIRNEVIKKKITDAQIKNAMQLCRRHGIVSNLFLMVGFPGETWNEVMATVRIGHKVGADMIGIHVTMPFPGTPLFDYAKDKGMIPKDLVDQYASGKLGRGFRGIWPLFIPEGLTLEDLVRAKKLAYRYFYLHPKWFWHRLLVWLRIKGKFSEDLKLLKIAWHVFRTGGTKGQLS
jgi:anaerobic magnesium-protoporphyrin IX monomethyl ester cyclase